ncbi:MAG TPA: MoaD/ThiS family protein [Nitrososphaeraceae archaeon]|nr:MoaD/ThiS family protein [Nitrososphaeraceae archaeon]
MITLKLLGGVKHAIGNNSIIIDKSLSTLQDIIDEIQKKSNDKRLVNEKNLLISVNGVESSLIGGKDAIIKTGDIITVVTVVHGG